MMDIIINDIINILNEPSNSRTNKFNIKIATKLMKIENDDYLKFMVYRIPESELYNLDENNLKIIYNTIMRNSKMIIEKNNIVEMINENIEKIDRNSMIIILSTISINVFGNLFKIAFRI